MKTVTFCGHANLGLSEEERIKSELMKELKKLICEGAEEFLLGGYGAFDLLCAHTLKELKASHPQIQSVLVIPYLGRDYDKNLYDCSEYPELETVPYRLAILKRNEWMVERSDAIISYVNYSWGGAAKTLAFAKRKKKAIISLGTK